MSEAQLDVYLDSGGTLLKVGQAWFTQRRGGQVATVFAYSANYLSQAYAIAIDPAFELVSGNQYVQGLPGAFQDCAPDRWGRNLINKRHRLTAASAGRQADLNEVDYLLGVSDRTRQGALRFTEAGSEVFVHPDSTVPKLIDLPRLLRASDQFAEGGDDFAVVKTLLDAGSGSLGGARPKASVVDTQGRLFVAKFPHQNDEWNVMAWEYVVLELAEIAGISVPHRQLVAAADGRSVLLLRRFDRSDGERRIPYISAMTALEAEDGELRDYSELADRITEFSASSTSDLAELFRRVLFSVAIHNTDDHLRNHGFLAAPGGWRLAPVFDINPNPNLGTERVTSILGATRLDAEPEGLRGLAEECRLSSREVAEMQSQIAAAVAAWRRVASGKGIPEKEIRLFAPVFER